MVTVNYADSSVVALTRHRRQVAVLIPCLDESASIATVVKEFSEALPKALIIVGDNNSRDDTARIAREAGAVVLAESRRGKGHMVRNLFANVEAEIYLLVDGDGTYDPKLAPTMVDLVAAHGYDMVVGVRRSSSKGSTPEFRRGHRVGNRLFSALLRRLFGGDYGDVFSGYRVMSRRFVKSFPCRSAGFDIETEMTAHAAELDAPYAELDSDYEARQQGSDSKLRTYHDGARITLKAIRLFKELRPLRFFTSLSVICFMSALALGVPIVIEFAGTGKVPRFPTAILATAIGIIAFLLLTAGLILDSVSAARIEARRLAYLALPSPSLRREIRSRDFLAPQLGETS